MAILSFNFVYLKGPFDFLSQKGGGKEGREGKREQRMIPSGHLPLGVGKIIVSVGLSD